MVTMMSLQLPQVVRSITTLTTVTVLLYYCGHVKGVMISPPEIASVCSGDMLELTCTTAGTFIEWSFFLIPEGETTARRYKRILHAASVPSTSQLEVNSITFTFSITSAHNSLPLISILVINSVNDDLNGTDMNCTDVVTSNYAITSIVVINENDMISGHQNIEITILSKYFESSRDGVTVTLEWTKVNESLYSYSYYVSAVPQLISIMSIGSTMIRFKVPYNIWYNVSVLAASPCEQNNVIAFIEVYYANCGNPADQVVSSIVNILGYRDPAIEGSNVTISCLSGRVLSGPNIATCMGNGEWEPDIREIQLNCSDMMVSESVVTPIPDSNNDTFLGSVFGVVLSILFLTLGVVVIIIFFKVKLRGANDNVKAQYHECERYAETRESTLNTDNQKNATVTGPGLIYADIAQSSFNQQLRHMTSTHDLDDGIEYAQLNHNLSVNTGSQKAHVDPTEKDRLRNSLCINLDNLLIQLRPEVTTKWHQFGEAVGIEKEVLDNCTKNCSPEDCIVEMLDYWLRNIVEGEQPTWKDIAEALKAINLQQLAHDIEMVYTTGKLPVEVDMNQIPQFQKGSSDSESPAESPPPLPPKLTDSHESQTYQFHYKDQHEIESLPKSRVAAETQASAPALPPK